MTPWEQAKQEVEKEVKTTSAGNRQDTIDNMQPAPPPKPDNSEAMTELKRQRKALEKAKRQKGMKNKKNYQNN